jgi:6-pyruvoyltetrahydropterin/6-carboxytetrahydropterin synthase
MEKIYLKLKAHFDAAHYLRDYVGQCANLHGHRWHVNVVVSGDKQTNGLLINFEEVRQILSKVLPDHQCLNDIPPFCSSSEDPGGMSLNPTAENISVWLFDRIQALLPPVLTLDEIEVWESENAAAVYKGRR